jgi:hypothetical protein
LKVGAPDLRATPAKVAEVAIDRAERGPLTGLVSPVEGLENGIRVSRDRDRARQLLDQSQDAKRAGDQNHFAHRLE